MNKATRNYWLDVLMGMLALIVAVSSVLLWVVFPRGYYPARTLWVAIHKWVGLALGSVALLHVALHWKWLTRMTRRRIGRTLASGSRSRDAVDTVDGPPGTPSEGSSVPYRRYPGQDSTGTP